MKEITKIGAQGDVLFERIDQLPSDAKAVITEGKLLIARSETGHHHSILDPIAQGVVHFESPNPNICYLRIDGAHADVVHERSFDTHETMRLIGQVWRVRRQREQTPEGWVRRVED